jgi:dihydropyrimidinase
MKLVIKNGFLVANSYYGYFDIEIDKDKIVNISKNILPKNHKILDAKGKIVIPGIIDAHVHFGLKGYGSKTLESFYTGSKTALFSGITTVIDYVIPKKGENFLDAFKHKLSQAKKSFVDYTFHLQIVDFNKDTPRQIKDIISSGIKSFKIFLPKTEDWYIDDEKLHKILNELQRYKKVVLEAHCEDSNIIEPLVRKLERQNKLSVKYFPFSRPNLAEVSAVKRFINVAKNFTTDIYIVHISSKESITEIVSWKKNTNKNFNLFAETCPQYLTFTKKVFQSNKNYLYTCCPPIKTYLDKKILWENLRQGFIDVIATDNCVFSKKDKYNNRKDFRKIPMGLPGTTVLLYQVLTEGIKRKIDLKTLVNSITFNPSKIFGLYPKKGDFVIGKSDADIVVLDINKQWILKNKNLITVADYSPYENMNFCCKIENIIFKGEIVLHNGIPLKISPKGVFLKR